MLNYPRVVFVCIIILLGIGDLLGLKQENLVQAPGGRVALLVHFL
jgi:hypothetical protein